MSGSRRRSTPTDVHLQSRLHGKKVTYERKKPTTTKVPDGTYALFDDAKEPNEKGFVGYETVWEPFQKEAEYKTPKKP